MIMIVSRTRGNRPAEKTVNSTPTNAARTELHNKITFHHANTRDSRAASSGTSLCP